MLGTGAWNLRNWEAGRHGVEVRFLPAITRFLGYCPLPAATNQGESIRRARMARGWSRKRLAATARVDEATVRRIEESAPRLTRRPIHAVRLALQIEQTAAAECATPIERVLGPGSSSRQPVPPMTVTR